MGSRFYHYHRIPGSGNHQIESAAGKLGKGGVDYELVVHIAYPHRTDRASKGNAGNSQGYGGTNNSQYVGIVLLVRREDSGHNLNLIVETFGE
ncbi:MAG: hypothetical protein DDT26_02262 [Dehalococcoidia bacterium]|nr:hypothetical protein [Chloroflexota bacterium]